MVRGNVRARRAKISQKKRRQWSAREKLMVIAYYEQGYSKRSTAAKFEIEPKQLRDWLKNKDQLMIVAPYIQKLVKGARPKYQQLETELIEWFRDSRRQLKTISRYMIQAKACSLAKKPLYQRVYPDIREAKFSQNWVDGFMYRNNLVNRKKTTIARRLPDDYIEQQNQFLSYVLFRRTEHQYPLSLIANMDETPMAFNLPSNTTLEHRGTKSVAILSTGHERANFTVVLACMANGEKLPPVIIFNLVNIPREDFPDGVIVRANPNGWMNEEEMTWWIENIWTQRAKQGSNPRSLLVLDSFSVHKTDAIKRRFHRKNTDLAIIPGGLTSRLQPIDVSLNKSFKAKMRHLYDHWMNEAIKEYTPSGKIKRPSYSLVANWVKESWDAIDTNLIIRSFKCCGVSNAMDGTEDDLIFNFNKVQKINNKGRGIEANDEIHEESSNSDYEPDDNGSDDSDNSGCESDDDYYNKNENRNVLQDWN
ncbi:hypothetical protein RIR_jg12104.t1 [Rhizophagus irregularis DAOM 181602=DAOM 197198]|uniref:HTH CENPB-type domain-containing protein n=1 Tax=Rhizophagus irregularis (strain DAOM 197198w) TaxID=1432141 RepID=A0A015N2B7_RHIIW|nr:hypothetical protein RirG_061810 [Rhizophagus irregularis DAOM 197198w]GBC32710.1 hypothetical protein RIR_jg12104.t1 [Rhizophagus irregularis DAOM 181602=DAOM 197198]